MRTPSGNAYTYVLAFAALSWLVVGAYFWQVILAGQFLSGTYAALNLHQLGATVSDVLLFLAAIVGALLRWRAKGAAWPFWAALGLLMANQAQNGAGAARLIFLHIPLGATMLAVAVVLALAASRTTRNARRPAVTEATTGATRQEAL